MAAGGQAVAEPEQSGTWRATFATEDSERREATLVIDVTEGTWTVMPQNNKVRRDKCDERPFPVVLVGSGSSTVTMFIQASKVNPDCKNRNARLTVVDTDTLEGEFESGKIIRLERIHTRR